MTSATRPDDATRVACQAFGPIYWSPRDTDETIAQIKEHNAGGKSLCGWGIE